MTEELAAAGTDRIENLLFERGTLVDLYIGRWTANKKLSKGDVLLDKIDESAIYLGHKKLLPKKAMEDLVTLEGKARTALAGRSAPFPISGARFVTYEALPNLLDRLKELKEQWLAEVDRLVTDYPDYKEEQLKILDEQAEKLAAAQLSMMPQGTESFRTEKEKLDKWVESQKKTNRELYPPSDSIRVRFPFEWRMFRVAAVEGQELNPLAAQEFAAAQSRMRADLRDWVRQMSTMMHQELGKAARNAQEMLEKNGKLTARNLRPLFESFEEFKALDLTGASDFHQTIEQLKTRFFSRRQDGSIDYDSVALTTQTEDGRRALSELLLTMGQLAVQEVAANAGLAALTRTGEFGRALELD